MKRKMIFSKILLASLSSALISDSVVLDASENNQIKKFNCEDENKISDQALKNTVDMDHKTNKEAQLQESLNESESIENKNNQLPVQKQDVNNISKKSTEPKINDNNELQNQYNEKMKIKNDIEKTMAKKFGLSLEHYQRNFAQFNLYVSKFGKIDSKTFSNNWQELWNPSNLNLHQRKAKEFLDYVKMYANFDEQVIEKIITVCSNEKYRRYLLMLFLNKDVEFKDLIKSELLVVTFPEYHYNKFSNINLILRNQFSNCGSEKEKELCARIDKIRDFVEIDESLQKILQDSAQVNDSSVKKVDIQTEETLKEFNEFMQCKFNYYVDYFNKNQQYDFVCDQDSLVAWRLNKYLLDTPQPIDDKCKTVMEKLNSLQNTLGIKNLGSTYYMNAVLQCLANNPELASYLYNKTVAADLQKTPGKYLIDLVRTLWRKENYYSLSIEPNQLWNYCYSSYQADSLAFPFYNQAGDPKLAIRSALLQLHEVLKVSSNIINVATNNNMQNNKLFELEKFLIRNNNTIGRSVIYDLYSSVSVLKGLCTNCKEKSNGESENFYNYSYNRELWFEFRLSNVLNFVKPNTKLNQNDSDDIDKWPAVSIKDCFKYLCRQQTCCVNSQLYCGRCNQNSVACIQTELVKLPRFLTIILDRGKYQLDPVNCVVDWCIDLNDFVIAKRPCGGRYELCGMIVTMTNQFFNFQKKSWENNYVYVTKPFDKWCLHDAEITLQNDYVYYSFDGKKFPNLCNESPKYGLPYIVVYRLKD